MKGWSRQHDGLVVDHMKRMPELSGVPHARHLSQVVAMHLEEFHKLSRALIREAEHHPMLDVMFGRILGDAPENGEPAFDGGVDGHQIAGFHVRQNALPGRCQRHEVSPIVTLDVMGEARIMFMRAPGVAPSPGGKQPVEIYLEVEDVDALHNRLKKKGVAISDPLTLQWWGDRTFKVLDPNGYEIWFYTNVAEPRPPQGAKLV